MNRSKRVLYVSYLFPPTGGVGVMRAVKFVKFLPEFGWDVTVLTVENPSVPMMDESLLDQIPDQTIIRTARTLEPGYAVKQMVTKSAPDKPSLFGKIKTTAKRAARTVVNSVLQPDTGILWYRGAVKEGLRAIDEQSFDVIIATAPPFSTLLVGAALAEQSGLPLVLDFRDEWSISSAYWENKSQGPISNAVQRRMQHRALRAAHTILATTPGSAVAIAEIARQAGSNTAATHIYNGYDPTDFPPKDESLEREDFGNGSDRFRISFVGTLWALNSIEPFVEAVSRLSEREPQLLERLEIVIAGRQVGEQVTHLDRLKTLPCKTEVLGFLEHKQALRLMATSDWLLQLQSDLPGLERVISCKVFEYMGAGQPVLSVTPEGDQCDVIRQHPGATLCYPHDPDGIATAVEQRLRAHLNGEHNLDCHCDVSQFERRTLTAQLAELLDQIRSGGEEGSASPQEPELAATTPPSVTRIANKTTANETNVANH